MVNATLVARKYSKYINIRKPICLSRNFRSHSGILNVAAEVVQKLLRAFPGSIDKCLPDQGLANGPRPQVYRAWTRAEPMTVLPALLRQNERRRVLVWDHSKAQIAKPLRELAGRVLGIRESKGLEYSHVIIVDFFACLPKPHQQAWKWLASHSGKDPVLPVELVLQLKMLYVAITRCCHNLAFLETQDSPAGKAWFRNLVSLGLAVSGKGWESKAKEVMSADEWLVEGLKLAATVDGCGSHDADIDQIVQRSAARLSQASSCFDKAGNTALATRARLQCKILLASREAASAARFTAPVNHFVSSLVHCLKQGLYCEVIQILKNYMVMLRRSRLTASGTEAKRVHQNQESFMRRLLKRIGLFV